MILRPFVAQQRDVQRRDGVSPDGRAPDTVRQGWKDISAERAAKHVCRQTRRHAHRCVQTDGDALFRLSAGRPAADGSGAAQALVDDGAPDTASLPLGCHEQEREEARVAPHHAHPEGHYAAAVVGHDGSAWIGADEVAEVQLQRHRVSRLQRPPASFLEILGGTEEDLQHGRHVSGTGRSQLRQNRSPGPWPRAPAPPA